MIIKHRVGPLADIPSGVGVRVEVGEHAIAVFRVDDGVRAIADACPHLGASLSEGMVDGRIAVCPWHGWTFDLDDGTSPIEEDVGVACYRAFIEDGDVFVEVEGGGLADGAGTNDGEDAGGS